MGVACPSAPRSSKNTGGCSRETVGVEEHNCWTYSSHGQRQPAHHNGAGNTHIIIFTPISVGGKGCQRRLHVDQSAETAVCRGVDWIGSTGVLNPIVGRGIRIFHPDHGEKQYVSVLIIQVVSSKLLPTGGNWVNNEGITSCIAMYRAVHWIIGWDAQHADPTYNEIFPYPWLWFIVHRGRQNTMGLSFILDLFQSVFHILPE